MKRFRLSLLPLLASTLIVLAGCGSSKSPSAGSSTSPLAAGSTGTNPSSAGLSASSSVNSPAAIKFLVQEGEKGGLSPSQSMAYISCFEKTLAARGITTFAQFHAKLTSLFSARDACIAKAKKG